MGIVTKMFVAFLAYIIFAVAAIAEVPQSAATPIAVDKTVIFDSSLEDTDLRYAFGTSQNLQANVMTRQDMNEVEGAVAPVVVYGLMAGSRVVYVGITNNLARRTAQHAATKTFSNVKVLGSSPTRTGARVIEQNNINRYNTINNGLNKVNSISPKKPLANQVTVPYRNR